MNVKLLEQLLKVDPEFGLKEVLEKGDKIEFVMNYGLVVVLSAETLKDTGKLQGFLADLGFSKEEIAAFEVALSAANEQQTPAAAAIAA